MTFLLPKPTPEPLESITLRLPASLAKYIRDTAEANGLTHTAIATDALRLNRDLSARLDAAMPRIRLWALRHSIDPYYQLPEVLARLVESALGPEESEKANL